MAVTRSTLVSDEKTARRGRDMASQALLDVQTSSEWSHAMKKHNAKHRKLVLRKEAISVLAPSQLEDVAGGIESRTLPTLCLTVKTCASFEFAC
jgi:hypothetical protein